MKHNHSGMGHGGRLDETALDPEDHDRNHQLLSDLQGNILKSHGRNFTVHLFLRFKRDHAVARDWLRQISNALLTSAMDQHDAAQERRESLAELNNKGMSEEQAKASYHGKLFASLMLSASGYRALGFAEDQLPEDKGFRLGMKHGDTHAWLHDPPVEKWEPGFQKDIHVLLILAHNLDPALKNDFQRDVERIKAESRKVADIVVTDYGIKIERDNQTIEHFGFADGISNPVFLADDVHKSHHLRAWDASAPLGLALARDPNGLGPESYGSYFVYRKLKQDVHLFGEFVQQLADGLAVSPERAAASVIGRFKNGIPLAKYDLPVAADEHSKMHWNDFNFDHDSEGVRCPFPAHIRKANPRGEKSRQQLPPNRRKIARYKWLLFFYPKMRKDLHDGYIMERQSRIVRRGITYGPKEPSKGDEVGLLFMCAQANIGLQFEFIQALWANKNTFPRDDTGLDPIIGQGYQQAGGQLWPTKWGDRKAELEHFDFSGCVTLRGGEYFFAPSISFLKSL